MLKSTVPTPVTLLVPLTSAGGLALASMMKTSRSGRLNGTWAFQLRLISSTQLVPLNLTMRPVGGAPAVDPAGGGGNPPFAVTLPSMIDVVRLPEWNAAAKTRDPSGVRASARGVSANSAREAIGVPPSAVPSAVAS